MDLGGLSTDVLLILIDFKFFFEIFIQIIRQRLDDIQI